MSEQGDFVTTIFGIQQELGQAGEMAQDATENTRERSVLIEEINDKFLALSGLVEHLVTISEPGNRAAVGEAGNHLDAARKIYTPAFAGTSNEEAINMGNSLTEAETRQKNTSTSTQRLWATAKNLQVNLAPTESMVESLIEHNIDVGLNIHLMGGAIAQAKQHSENYLGQI